MNLKKTAVYIVVFLILIVVVFIFVYRPRQLTWGATDEEVNRSMVGDDIVENPTFNATRAVTINACPEDIWPWIIQIGYKKAGFYSYDILDNDGIASAERIIPKYQDLKVGDLIPMSKDINARVAALESNKYMLMVFDWGKAASWSWGLYKINTGHTRLVTRLRARHESIIARVLLDMFEIVMMRKCMLGIKRRAESLPFQFGNIEEQGFQRWDALFIGSGRI